MKNLKCTKCKGPIVTRTAYYKCKPYCSLCWVKEVRILRVPLKDYYKDWLKMSTPNK